jgi:ribosomal-protein-serine acetyltransferase
LGGESRPKRDETPSPFQLFNLPINRNTPQSIILQESPLLSLEPPEKVSSREFYQLINGQRPYLQQWLSWVDMVRSEEDAERLLADARRYNIGGQQLIYYIFFDHYLAGSVALTRIDRNNRSAQLGYWLREEVQGEGIAPLACRQLLSQSFETLSLHRLEIRTDKDNLRSQAIARKLGFSREGLLRQAEFHNGTFRDVLLFALLKEDWTFDKKNRK